MLCPMCAEEIAAGSLFCPLCGSSTTGRPAGRSASSGKAIASLVLGIIGLVAWCIPLIGLPITITGLVLGLQDWKLSRSGLALAGAILCGLGLAAGGVNAVIGAYLGATGQLPWQQQSGGR